MAGWVKLDRNINKAPIFHNPDLLKMWVWCLCKASYSKSEQVVGNQKVKIEQGCFLTGRKVGAEDIRCSESTFYRRLKLLETWGMIEIKNCNKYSIISVKNWEKYQQMDNKRTTDEQQMDNKRATDEQQMDTIKKEKKKKERKEGKEERGGNPVPPSRPTLEELQGFIKQNSLNVDSVRFMDYYTSNGWKVGKNDMKDWKATIRNWSRREQGDKTTKGYPQEEDIGDVGGGVWK